MIDFWNLTAQKDKGSGKTHPPALASQADDHRTDWPRPEPFIEHGELRIPLTCDPKYRWWAGGQSILDTLFELNAPDEVIQKYVGPILTARSWERWQQEKTTEP